MEYEEGELEDDPKSYEAEEGVWNDAGEDTEEVGHIVDSSTYTSAYTMLTGHGFADRFQREMGRYGTDRSMGFGCSGISGMHNNIFSKFGLHNLNRFPEIP